MADIKIKDVSLVPINELKQNPKNRNIHPKEQLDELARHYEVHGMRTPLIVSNQSGHIVSGNGRYMAALKAGLKELPVSFQDFDSPEKEYAFGIADNGLSLWSDLDLSSINTDIQDLGPDFNLDDLGIRGFEIDVADKYDEETEDVVPEVVEPKSKLGDIYKLGNHRLLCGDSTNIQHVERLMGGEKADMVFTDPPYNQPESGGKNDSIGKALHKQTASISHLINFEPKDFLNLLPMVFLKTMNAYVFTSKDLLPDYLLWARDSGYSFNVLVWKKPTAIPIGGSHRPDVEYLLVFRRSGTFNSGVDGVNYSKVIEAKRDSTGLHPTMKPIEIIENQLKIGSPKFGNVVDFFGGSGSTIIACEKTNRKCFMMELDPHYCDVIVARWEKYTGQKSELING